MQNNPVEVILKEINKLDEQEQQKIYDYLTNKFAKKKIATVKKNIYAKETWDATISYQQIGRWSKDQDNNKINALICLDKNKDEYVWLKKEHLLPKYKDLTKEQKTVIAKGGQVIREKTPLKGLYHVIIPVDWEFKIQRANKNEQGQYEILRKVTGKQLTYLLREAFSKHQEEFQKMKEQSDENNELEM